MSALRAHARHILALLVLMVGFVLHKRSPGGGGDSPSGKPGGTDGTASTPSQKRGNIDASKGVTSAQDATSEAADAGTPANGSAGTGNTSERPNQWTTVQGSPPPVQNINLSPGRRTHIMDGDANGVGGGHFPGTGIPGKTEFPERWLPDEDDPAQPELDATIAGHIEDVARNPDSPPRLQDNGRWVVNGTRDGVDIEVIVNPDGSIWTAYPTGGRGVTRNDENGDPQPLDE
ncbi:MAG: EndoU domain-containing protein [Kibdelosporangium sp.]